MKWNDIPPTGKIVIVIAGSAVAITALVLIGAPLYKGIKNALSNKDEKKEVKESEKEIKKLENQGQKPNYSDAQFRTWANSLKEAFDGCGTSNQTWRTIFGALKNDLDVAKLNATYGVRTFDKCNWEFDFGDFTGTLGQAITHELNGPELVELNKMLEKKGITYRY